ncbi:uncharacterized protein isoform X2 [Leptinotarsa decemlineata]|uniref:uncharacterized protein isoform X2 n=1 Tax=Leptinotarsa decemlineata TaxID=7539 RepID=UPI003D305E14
MNEEKLSENVIPWMDELSTQSTTIPEIIDEESKQIATVVVFVISAVLAITLLFIAAVFIDCRQEKLEKLQAKPIKRKIPKLRLPLPRIGLPVREDENSIVDRIEYAEPSSSHVIV